MKKWELIVQNFSQLWKGGRNNHLAIVRIINRVISSIFILLQILMKEIKRLFWLEAAFYLIFGCCLVAMPSLGLSTVVVTFAIQALIFWITGIAFAIKNPWIEDRTLVWISALLTALVWLLLLCFPWAWELIILVFVAVLWIAIAVKWVMMIIDSFEIKKLKVENWYLVLILWILVALIWLFMACNSLLTTLAFNMLIWIYMIAGAIAMIIWGIKVKKGIKKVKKGLENIDEIEIEVR